MPFSNKLTVWILWDLCSNCQSSWLVYFADFCWVAHHFIDEAS